MLFFGYAIQYSQKINMSVSIVCMINQTALKLDPSNTQVVGEITDLNETETTQLNESLNETEPISDGCLFQTRAKNTIVSYFGTNITV